MSPSEAPAVRGRRGVETLRMSERTETAGGDRAASKREAEASPGGRSDASGQSAGQAGGAALPGARRRGPVHRARGRPSGRRPAPELRQRVLARYGERYPDFGPTLAVEELVEEGLSVDHEKLRRWLFEAGTWTLRRRRSQHRQWRERKVASARRCNWTVRTTIGLKCGGRRAC